ncbi:PREDICTED: methionine--tRNA ligase, cytoplasmic [Ceratosolen solmsi marchali]|uniref:Methionine--tRNA ligase, cytoplasmic n=1 Tax=Ceratosolen solmsi marchali TaxID=326594 RepID=A0AAJ7DXT1_9HYME|nr:PREDICTED: methionine--tRNA ligase, cytoplasmic [Ceratosolen solmsi marchali]
MNVTSNPNNPNALKLIVAAEISKKELAIEFTSDPKQCSLNRLPTLKIDSSRKELFSVNAAVQYISPISNKDVIVANRWLEWDVSQLQPAIVSYGGSGKLDVSHKPRIWSLIKELNASLKNKEYLIKDKDNITIVDASIWVTLWSTVVVTDMGEVIRKEFPNVDRWLKHIESLPIIKKCLEKMNLERGIQAIMSMNAASWFPLNSYTGVANSQIISAEKNNNNLEDKEIKAITDEEINLVKNSWTSVVYPSVKEIPYPVLPKKGEKNILVTSALPYVNNVPHLGNIIGCVLSADIFARYCRQRNYNTLYISGTDEYGTATEAKALEEKVTPQQICDKFFDIHNDIYRWFSIGFDYFGRTTTSEQTEIVQAMFLRIKDKGYVLTNIIDQLLCENCDRFLADRFVEGTCPRCKYEDARGDQCDGCGHLVNATELINPRCKVCSNKPVIKASTQFFLDLPKIQENLKQWASKVEDGWSLVAKTVTKPWLRDGLKARCITRDLKWGIPVPLDGYRDKVFYVWFDAPLGYLSITKKYTKEYEKWWKPNNVDVNLYQFMAKDNVPFHAIMFPATLLAANEDHILVKHIMATEYLNYEDTKFSKSRGIGVFGTDARETGISADVWRFYLAYIRPESMDSNFNWVDLATKNNSELLNNLGNFINRALMFVEKNFNSKIPQMELSDEDMHVLALVQRELTNYISFLEQAKLRDGLKHVLAISKHGNQYMQYQQPWVKIKGTEEEKKKGATVIGVCCNISCLISALLAPFMPNTAREIRVQLGLSKQNYGYIPEILSIMLPAGHSIGKPSPLFSKIEEKQVEELRHKYGGKQSVSVENSQDSTNLASLEKAVANQAQLVRDLKAKQGKDVWQPQVQILLDLKKKLAEFQVNSNVSGQATAKSKSSSTAAAPEQNGNVTAEITELEAAVLKQGNLVRELKAKNEKSVWQPQVEVLLQLKQKLSALTGAVHSPPPGDKKSKKKKINS